MKIERFEDLEVWKDARRLANLVYELTKKREFAKDYGLRDQMRRAAVSVMSNIPEGFESRTRAMFVEYLGRSKGSAGELRAQFYLASDQAYITASEFRQAYDLAESCSKQLGGLIKYLESSSGAQYSTRTGTRTPRKPSV
jgi:four helix bundle protein